MLDPKIIRENPEKVAAALARRSGSYPLDDFLRLDQERRALLGEVEAKKAARNTASAEIGKLMKAKQDASAMREETRVLGEEIAALDEKLRGVEDAIRQALLYIPNLPNEKVPSGADDTANVELRRWGEPRKFDFEPKPHWDLGEALDGLDFARAGKISGARFTVYKGAMARLERALVNFFLDMHTEKHGYTEVFPPFMVNSASMTATGQLPKFAEDAFRLADSDLYLVPTAEVPVTNLFRDEILDGEDLPIKLTAYTACFRSEAGAAGRDTRGLIRQHQFNKVEMVKFALPENSYEELESLTHDAEEILQALGLPYRVVMLSSGDLGFSSAMTYDLEVWLPSANCYREISSCSNFESYQARRGNIRFRRKAGAKPEFVHTLNGSGVAVGRTVAAIMENYQQEDGSIEIPAVLRPYMGMDRID